MDSLRPRGIWRVTGCTAQPRCSGSSKSAGCSMAACGQARWWAWMMPSWGNCWKARNRPPQPFCRRAQTRLSSTRPLEELLNAIGTHYPRALASRPEPPPQLRMGLGAFVTDLVPAFDDCGGRRLAQGRFEIYAGAPVHQVITGVLRHAISTLAPQPVPRAQGARRPRCRKAAQPGPADGGSPVGAGGLHLRVRWARKRRRPTLRQARAGHRADAAALSFNVHKPALVQASRQLRAQPPPPPRVGGWRLHRAVPGAAGRR